MELIAKLCPECKSDLEEEGAFLYCLNVECPEQIKGRIVHMASDAALYGSPRLSHYIASKGAVIALTRAMARELGLPYREDQRGSVQTAQGTAGAFFLKLDKVRVGGINIRGVEATASLRCDDCRVNVAGLTVQGREHRSRQGHRLCREVKRGCSG